MAVISADGTMQLGEGYTPDDVAKQFLYRLAVERKGLEAQFILWRGLEAKAVELGRIDARYEQAQAQARHEGATAADVEREKTVQTELSLAIHDMIEFGRALAERTTDPDTHLPQTHILRIPKKPEDQSPEKSLWKPPAYNQANGPPRRPKPSRLSYHPPLCK